MNSLADRRIKLGLSKYKVAKALGCSWPHYHLFERGERKLSPALTVKLETFLAAAEQQQQQQQQTKP